MGALVTLPETAAAATHQAVWRMRVVLCVLLAVLCISTSNAQLLSSPVACDNEEELLSALEWVRETCEEAGEVFLDSATLVPTAVSTAECADAVHRVSQRCGDLLSRSDWFETRRTALATAAFFATSAGFPAEPNVVRGGRTRSVNRRVTLDLGAS